MQVIVPRVGREPDVINVSITNIGEIDVIVEGLWLLTRERHFLRRLRHRWKSYAFLTYPMGHGMLPRRLGRGEVLSIGLPADECLAKWNDDGTRMDATVFAARDTMGRFHACKSALSAMVKCAQPGG